MRIPAAVFVFATAPLLTAISAVPTPAVPQTRSAALIHAAAPPLHLAVASDSAPASHLATASDPAPAPHLATASDPAPAPHLATASDSAPAAHLAAASGAAPALDVAPASEPVANQPFANRREPPPYRRLTDKEAAEYELGLAVFNTQFVVAGTPNAGCRDGIGPLFNAASCDECHNNGARGRGPMEDGPLPAALVIQLGAPSPQNPSDPEGDPAYGRVFNTLAVEGVPPEGVATVEYLEASGRYADGVPWKVRVPRYTLTQLRYGPLSAHTIVKPRLAPALFGAGLLDAISDTAQSDHGRFGWQASATSVGDQTARAFAREMGLTSTGIGHDDCTSTEKTCLRQPGGGSPEISKELFDAVVNFQRWLAVPASPTPHRASDPGRKLFADLGCSNCHQVKWSVRLTDSNGRAVTRTIEPYTDLRLHDLGEALADESVAGEKVASRWRTAPLWGLGYRMALEQHPTFLHDGRARSAEEAILWHDGEAANARDHFERLPSAERREFLHWLETL